MPLKRNTTHIHTLECFFILGCNLELSAWTVLYYWHTPLGYHALHSDSASSNCNYNWISSFALFLSQEDEGSLSWHWNSFPTAPSCCSTWSWAEKSRHRVFYSLTILPAPSWRVVLFSGLFHLLAFSVTSNTISPDCYCTMPFLLGLRSFFFLFSWILLLYSPSLLLRTVAGLDYFYPTDWKISHNARPHAGAEWLRTRSENQVLKIYFNQFKKNVQMNRRVAIYWLESLEPFKQVQKGHQLKLRASPQF